MKKKKKTKF